ncbi:MAG: quinone oxidoreductase [Granulosicoccus sp.]
MSEARQIIATKPGGIEVLAQRTLSLSEPAAGELRIRHTAIGVNFIDVYFRSGLYPWPVDKDLVLGSEAAGVVDAVGSGVDGFKKGDRVVYTVANGAYATHRNLDATQVVALPGEIDDETAAASMLKGLTAAYLLNHSYVAKAGDSVLFHAAAGGVGSIAGQWLKLKGVTTIGTAGGTEKCQLAAGNGYDHVIDYRSEDFVSRVNDITQGAGVDAVYDSVGNDTVAGSLACLKRFGTLVCFGQSSGPATEFKIADLAAGSLRLTRPVLFHYTANREWLESSATELFALIAQGQLNVAVNQRFSLDAVSDAHSALESRKTTGCTVLTV